MPKMKGTPEQRVLAIKETLRVSEKYGWGEYKIHPHLRKKGLPASYPLIRQAVTAARDGTLGELVAYQLAKTPPKPDTLEKEIEPQASYQFTENQETGEAKLVWFGPKIDDVSELLDFCQIDRTVWEVVKTDLTSHKTAIKIIDGVLQKPAAISLVNIHVSLKRKLHEIAIRKVASGLLEKLSLAAPDYGPSLQRSRKTNDLHLLEIAIVDSHVGALILKHQTGCDYTPEKAAESIPWATQQLVHQARGYEIEEVLFLVGNDLLHFDNFSRTTTKGTVMDDPGLSYDQAFILAQHSITVSIDWLLQNVAPVRVAIVPGNHDRNSMFGLGRTLEAVYSKCSDVTFAQESTPEIYIQYGVNLIALAHGDLGNPARTAINMPEHCREIWAECKSKSVHHGHKHEVLTRMQGKIMIQFLPTLCPPNKWAVEHGFLSERGAYAFAHHRSDGQVAQFSTPISKMDDSRPVVVM